MKLQSRKPVKQVIAVYSVTVDVEEGDTLESLEKFVVPCFRNLKPKEIVFTTSYGDEIFTDEELEQYIKE